MDSHKRFLGEYSKEGFGDREHRTSGVSVNPYCKVDGDENCPQGPGVTVLSRERGAGQYAVMNTRPRVSSGTFSVGAREWVIKDS